MLEEGEKAEKDCPSTEHLWLLDCTEAEVVAMNQKSMSSSENSQHSDDLGQKIHWTEEEVPEGSGNESVYG